MAFVVHCTRLHSYITDRVSQSFTPAVTNMPSSLFKPPVLIDVMCVVARFRKVVHHDGFSGPARSDSPAVQRFV